MKKARIYTDGACSGNPGEGGWAFLVLGKETATIKSGHEKETTNNRMELMAVAKALAYAHKNGYESIEILSDSAYVVNAFTRGWLTKWRLNNWEKSDGEPIKNITLWQKVYSLTQGLEIKITKVKGHSGVHFNEMVDEAARNEIKKHKRGT